MVDHARWDTAQVLAYGVLDRPMPDAGVPKDVNLLDVGGWDEIEDDGAALRDGLEKGGLEAHMYYGVWYIWKADDGYSGVLLQYRKVTERVSGLTLEKAIEQAQEWAGVCYG